MLVVTYLFVVYFQIGDSNNVSRISKLATLNLLKEIGEGKLHNADVLGATGCTMASIALR